MDIDVEREFRHVDDLIKAYLKDPERTLNNCRSVSEKLSMRTKKQRRRDIRSAKVVIQPGASSPPFFVSMRFSAGMDADSLCLLTEDSCEPWEADRSADIP